MTLCATDLHWVEMIKTVSVHNQKPLTHKQIQKMSIKECSEQFKANPVTSVTVFQYWVESFFRHYIWDSSNPLGKVNEYAVKIGFQECGLPYAHSLFWVDGITCIDVDNDDKFCSFNDTYVSGCVPDDSLDNRHISGLVYQYETHLHSSYCHHNLSCHFSVPKAPSPHTVICWETEDDQVEKDLILQNACDLLSRVYDVLDNATNSMSMDDVLVVLGISEDTYVQSLKMSQHGRNVILHYISSDVYANGCNHSSLVGC